MTASVDAAPGFAVHQPLEHWLHVPSAYPDPTRQRQTRRLVGAVLAAQQAAAASSARHGAEPPDVAPSVDACLDVAAAARCETVFLATGLPAHGPVLVAVSVAAALDPDPDYLLDLAGARTDGVWGRPVVEGLPTHLQDGVSVLRHDELPDGTLVASVVLARRTCDHDVVLTLRTAELPVVAFCHAPLIDLLEAVRPTGVRA